jgi:hypothetical protein
MHRGFSRSGLGEEVALRFTQTVAATLAAASVAVLASSCAGPSTARRAEVLPFIADDYAQALHDAKARKLPIFADSWAPW